MIGRFALLMLLFVPALASYAGFAFSMSSYLIAGSAPVVLFVQTAMVFCIVVPALVAITYPLMLRYVYDRRSGSVRNFLAYLGFSVLIFGCVTAAAVYGIVYGYVTPEEASVLFCLLCIAVMGSTGRMFVSRNPKRIET